jgi:hypothetical protein
MIAPPGVYRDAPALTPDEAAALVVRAIVEQPARIATEIGLLGAALQLATPRVARTLLNAAFRLAPDEAAPDSAAGQATPELLAMQQLLRGLHL